MGKVLRIFVVIILLLSIGALVLGSMLFARREILKGRTHQLEQGLIRIARSLEATSPEEPQAPEVYPERDISSVSAEILEDPTRGQFWNNYRQELEQMDFPVMDLNARRRELMSYYKIDPVTSKPELDPLTGQRIKEGPGTTQGVISDVIERAGEQYNILTATRQQLQITRRELVQVINELNEHKGSLRERLVEIRGLNEQIAELNRTIADLRRDLQMANDRIAEQELRLTDMEQEKLMIEEERNTLAFRVEELNATIREMQESGAVDTTDRTTARRRDPRAADIGTVEISLGAKGSIVSVDQKLLFVVMTLEQSFIDELLSGSTDGSYPMVELLVRRGEETPQFITKVQLTQLSVEHRLAIGEILPDWQQKPIKPGDIVYYQ